MLRVDKRESVTNHDAVCACCLQNITPKLKNWDALGSRNGVGTVLEVIYLAIFGFYTEGGIMPNNNFPAL